MFNLQDALQAFQFVFQLYNLVACAKEQNQNFLSHDTIRQATQDIKGKPYHTISSCKRKKGDKDNKKDDGQEPPKKSKTSVDGGMSRMDEVIMNAGYSVIGGELESTLPVGFPRLSLLS
jgi:hypothetical protein